jgi:hypothetical protein
MEAIQEIAVEYQRLPDFNCESVAGDLAGNLKVSKKIDAKVAFVRISGAALKKGAKGVVCHNTNTGYTTV